MGAVNRRRFLNLLNCTYSHSPSLALPLGELSPQATERVLAVTFSVPSPSSLRSDTSPRGRGKWGCRGRHFLRKSIKLRGKDPRKPKRFSWSVQGSLRGNRNPLRLFFFCQRFLLEKQKKMLCRSRKFAAVHQPFERLPSSSATAVIFTLASPQSASG